MKERRPLWLDGLALHMRDAGTADPRRRRSKRVYLAIVIGALLLGWALLQAINDFILG